MSKTLDINEYACAWQDKDSDKLVSCLFPMHVTKIDDITSEFGGSPRKQTKSETIIEGFKHVHNAAAAANLVGKKFIVNTAGRPTLVSSLPAQLLRNFPLPKEVEDTLTAWGQQKTAAKWPGKNMEDPKHMIEDMRIAVAAKRMFMELGASLQVVYAHSDNQTFILQVSNNIGAESIVEALFNGGENPNGYYFPLNFGLLKDIV